LPDARSQTSVVSRWFVIPIAAIRLPSTPAAVSASPTAMVTLSQISSASCSTWPGSGKCCRNSRVARPRVAPDVSMTSDVEPVVP
jgi:hypothetical protein